jgi:hypothetical protein
MSLDCYRYDDARLFPLCIQAGVLLPGTLVNRQPTGNKVRSIKGVSLQPSDDDISSANSESMGARNPKGVWKPAPKPPAPEPEPVPYGMRANPDAIGAGTLQRRMNLNAKANSVFERDAAAATAKAG